MGGCRRLSDPEVTAILTVLSENRYRLRDRALFLLGIRSGFRISELLSLTIGDVFQNGAVSDYISVARRNMKKKKAGRTVPLNTEAKAAICEMLEDRARDGLPDPKDALFKSREGTSRPLGRVMAWKILHHAYRACGLAGKLGTHSMRKTFAENVHETLGRDIFKTQKAMGHASLNSTAAYLSVDEDEIYEAIRNPKKRGTP